MIAPAGGVERGRTTPPRGAMRVFFPAHYSIWWSAL